MPKHGTRIHENLRLRPRSAQVAHARGLQPDRLAPRMPGQAGALSARHSGCAGHAARNREDPEHGGVQPHRGHLHHGRAHSRARGRVDRAAEPRREGNRRLPRRPRDDPRGARRDPAEPRRDPAAPPRPPRPSRTGGRRALEGFRQRHRRNRRPRTPVRPVPSGVRLRDARRRRVALRCGERRARGPHVRPPARAFALRPGLPLHPPVRRRQRAHEPAAHAPALLPRGLRRGTLRQP